MKKLKRSLGTEKEEMGIGQLETTRLEAIYLFSGYPAPKEDKTATLLYGVRGVKGPWANTVR